MILLKLKSQDVILCPKPLMVPLKAKTLDLDPIAPRRPHLHILPFTLLHALCTLTFHEHTHTFLLHIFILTIDSIWNTLLPAIQVSRYPGICKSNTCTCFKSLLKPHLLNKARSWSCHGRLTPVWSPLTCSTFSCCHSIYHHLRDYVSTYLIYLLGRVPLSTKHRESRDHICSLL